MGAHCVKVKKKLLWLWGAVQRAAERNFGWIAVLFALNYFTIFWTNYHVYQWEQVSVVLIDAVFLFVGVGAYVVALELIPVPRLGKALKVLSLLLSLLLAGVEIFSILTYQALFGAGMLTAILQTNPQEAIEFFSKYVGIKWVLSAMGVAAFLLLVRKRLLAVRFSFFCRHWQNRLLPILFVAGVGAGAILWQEYHPFILDDMLDIPAVQVGRAVFVSLKDIEAYENLERNMENTAEITENRSDIPHVVFILGESAYRGRMHLYGYDLENTPNLDELQKKGEIAVFQDTVSPKSATVAVLRELFTFHDVEDSEVWYHRNNFMDVLKAAGYRTYWISNQDSSGIWGNVGQFYANRCTRKMYTSRRESHEEHCKLDEELFPLIDEARQMAGEKNFYLIHLMGQHTLYYFRYSNTFKKFTKDDVHGVQAGLSEDKRTEIAQYANAIYYGDYVVSSIIDMFRKENALVIYLSDHGETLYDDGSDLVGHTEENPTKHTVEVPLIFWGSERFRETHPELWNKILSAVRHPYMTDDMIHTLMDIMEIHTKEFMPQKSVIHPEFDAGRKRMINGLDYDASMR